MSIASQHWIIVRDSLAGTPQAGTAAHYLGVHKDGFFIWTKYIDALRLLRKVDADAIYNNVCRLDEDPTKIRVMEDE